MRGAAQQAYECQLPEVLLEGPAGTGKSCACLKKIYMAASRHVGARLLIVRKTRASLTESGLVTFEHKVLPPDHPAHQGPSRLGRRSYRFPNSSEILVAGMDRASKILSTEFDLIYVQEATELTEEDWEVLTTRLRNGRAPFHQILGDCNPDRPTHWLNQRCLSGKTQRFCSRHEDNPLFWDEAARDWTQAGRDYLDRLQNLSGARKARLLEGRWAASEGLVYGAWDAAIHIVDRFVPDADSRRIWVIDFGFNNPFVWQEWAIKDDIAYRVHEIYRTGRLVKDLAAQILSVAQVNGVEAIVCDHDAEGRRTLEEAFGRPTTAARKAVTTGIQLVQERLRKASNGKPGLLLMRDALVEPDSDLRDQRLPCCSEEEVDGYIWSRIPGEAERPEKKNDHGMDCWRYLAAYLKATDPKRRRAKNLIEGET